MVSMEAGRAYGYRDDSPRVPTLSLGMSTVRLIVNKFESQYTRVASEEHQQLATYDPNIEKGYEDFPLDQSRRRVFFETLGFYLSRWIPSVTFGNFGVLAVTTGLFAPKMLSYLVVYPFCRLVFGTLYPAYASYKAVRTKNLKEYVKWMMYWIVFALFTCTETFTDVFLSWFPFYYEVKIVLVLWLLSPATKGSSILYRKFVHPALCRREQEIDEYIAKAKDQGYHTVLNLGTKGVNYATTVIMQTAIKGGGGLVQQIRKSYSLSDLTECVPCDERSHDEADDVMTEPRLIRRVPKSGYTPRRSASESATRSPMYFPEVDVDVRPRPRSDEPDFSHIKSTEDISSGYSSADNSASLTRTASLGTRARRTARTQVTTIKRPQAAEESEVIIEELRDDEYDYANMPSLVNLPAQIFMSHTDPPFLYQYVGDQVRIIQVLGDNPFVTKSNKNIEKSTGENTVISDKNVNDIAEKTVQKEAATNKTFDKTIESIKDSFENAIEPTKESSENTIELKKVSETVSDKHVPNEISVLEPVEVTENDKCYKDKVIHSKEYPAETESNIKDTEIAVVSVENSKETTVTLKETCQGITTYDAMLLSNDKKPDQDTTDLNALLAEDNSAESGDDEASFGTPDNSPKSKRKLAKGKYGKGKAPPPPIGDNITLPVKENTNTTSQESLVDIVNRMPNTTIKESGTFHRERTLQVVNPIAENKKRHKSKSPGRIPKGNTTTIGRLLQLPGKLAFWNKTDDTNKSKSDLSEVSDYSRRSSNIDQGVIDEFQSCADLTKFTFLETSERTEDQISFKDAFFESEDITQDIIDKSDALQKLIEAKIESHPEYKIVALHAEIPTTSKSTDV